MSDTTSKGIPYPESTDNTRIWEHFENMAEGIDPLILGVPDVQVFTASGTWTKPDNAVWAVVEVQAGGGGAAGCVATSSSQSAVAPGGGGGEFARGTFAASALGATEAVTAGAGGSAGTSTVTAGNGGGSSFGSHITANGGAGAGPGTASSGSLSSGAANGGAGGAGGEMRVQGGDGGNGVVVSAVAIKTNWGGSSYMGGMTRSSGVSAGASTGTQGALYGGGAAGPSNGPSNPAISGVAGGQGIVIVTTYRG